MLWLRISIQIRAYSTASRPWFNDYQREARCSPPGDEPEKKGRQRRGARPPACEAQCTHKCHCAEVAVQGVVAPHIYSELELFVPGMMPVQYYRRTPTGERWKCRKGTPVRTFGFGEKATSLLPPHPLRARAILRESDLAQG